MRFIFTVLAILLALTTATPTIAEEPGTQRYQAIHLPCGEEALGFIVFIIDTKEGHFWTWRTAAESRRRVALLKYEGRVQPGKKIGEVIWKEITSIGDKNWRQEMP